MAMTGGTVGKSLYIKALPEEKMLLNQRVAIIRIQICLKEYVNYVIKSHHIQNIITESKTLPMITFQWQTFLTQIGH